MARHDSLALGSQATEVEAQGSDPTGARGLGLVYDLGQKVIHFPSVEALIEFLKKAA